MPGVDELHPRNAKLSDFIPKLKANHNGESEVVDPLVSIRERIEQNRLEERRRLHRLGQLPPGDRLAPLSSSGASIGQAYLQSCEVQQARTTQAARQNRLKRQVAGPVPPGSWAESFLRAQPVDREAKELLEDEGLRYRVTSFSRLLMHHGTDVEVLTCTSQPNVTRTVPSLSDCCLQSMVLSSRERASNDLGQEIWEDIFPALPARSVLRIMALAGSLATLHPLSYSELQQLWSSGGSALPAHHARPGPDPVDDWDAEPVQEAKGMARTHFLSYGSRETLNTQPRVDLSFSPLTPKQLVKLLSQPATGMNVHLRVLSLAGWDLRRAEKSALQGILSTFVNLEALSLAGSIIDFKKEEGQEEAVDSPQHLWLSSLSRAMPNLRVLDLSFCSWVTDSLLRFIADHPSIFKQMKVLNVRHSAKRKRPISLRKSIHARHIVLLDTHENEG